MTTIPAWEIKRFVQSQTVAEHQADTMANLLRGPMLLAALQSPYFDDEESGRKILNLYLNECRFGKDADWYKQTQESFLKYHPSWVELFDDVRLDRLQQGSKGQKSNVMGDWLALSHLRGTPMPFEMLATSRKRDPRTPAPVLLPTDEIFITAAPPKEDFYKHVFEQLYMKHKDEHRGWNALLGRQTIRGLTSKTWDAYVSVFPNDVSQLVQRFNLNRGYEGLAILRDLQEVKNPLQLAREMVSAMQSGLFNEMYTLFDDETSFGKDAVLLTPSMSEALYETIPTRPEVRSKLSTEHLVHIVNGDPSNVETEMDYAVAGFPNAHACGALVAPKYMELLNPVARQTIFELMARDPVKYLPVVARIVNSDVPTVLTSPEMEKFLQSTYIQAFVIESMMEKRAGGFCKNYMALYPQVVDDLNAASFDVENVYETIVLKHMTPTLSYADACEVRNIAVSLGITTLETRAMMTMALDGTSTQKSLSIAGLLDESPSHTVFPA